MAARIYRQAKGATQSGLARAGAWVLVYDREDALHVEPLMGWTSSGDMKQQITLRFETCEEAVAYAERERIAYRVETPTDDVKRRTMAYSDNFKFNRIGPWTH